MKENVLIIGAGAIGRGFLPWVLPPSHYDISFIDTNKTLIHRMQEFGSYTTYQVQEGGLVGCNVTVKEAFHPSEFETTHVNRYSLIFINVGSRQCVKAAKLIEIASCPVILCENDIECVQAVKAETQLKTCYFGIPDVIASNTAPHALLAQDPLSLITENGILFYEKEVGKTYIKAQACDAEEFKKQWLTKLYLHNTSHCVAAYLGVLAECEYVHETMQKSVLAQVVEGCMQEMLCALKWHFSLDPLFLEWYAKKELVRFSNPLLYDPISRVAREPLRKLHVKGRLLGAAQICLTQGIVPENLLLGIVSALLFDNPQDPDRHLPFMRQSLSHSQFLTYILGLRTGEPLYQLLNTRFTQLLDQLQTLSMRGSIV